ncbi:MAG TPA: hypothetical protein VKY73_07565 [Polyangiaceae bacterium]|nr:hypothetical protein [Polyangiaceae bacterium]
MKSCAVASVFAACLFAHCRPTDRCLRGATRCSHNVAEICDADGSYHELADCDLVSEQSGAPFVCAFVDETTEDGRVTGHTCVPADEPGADEGDDR